MSTWEKYRDMIDLPYPGESKHTRMPVRDRAAQFAPFAALTGFGAVLKETERITEKRIVLDEYEKEEAAAAIGETGIQAGNYRNLFCTR